jgi:DNA-binding response OmpR family regulator
VSPLVRILLAEDDPFTGGVLAKQLTKEGCTVDWVKDGKDVPRMQAENRYTLLLLDRGLPDCDGLELCSELRGQGDTVPIIMLTSHDAVDDRVKGLDYGADDYVCKPYIFPELLVRIRRLITRANLINAANMSESGKIDYRLSERTIVAGKAVVYLSKREAALFEILFRQAGQPVSRQRLATAIWEDAQASTDAIDPLISQLRRRIEPLKSLCSIENLRGRGFMLRLEG